MIPDTDHFDHEQILTTKKIGFLPAPCLQMETSLHVMSTSGRPPAPEQCLHRHTGRCLLYLQPLACPRPSFTPVWRILCWPRLALTHLWPILFVWLWPSLTSVWLVFGPPSPQFSSSSAQAASPQFSFSWAQPHLNSAPLMLSLASVRLLCSPALPYFSSSLAHAASPQFGSSSAQLRLSSTHFSSTMAHAHLHCHKCLLHWTDTFLPLTRLLLSCMTLPSSLRL